MSNARYIPVIDFSACAVGGDRQPDPLDPDMQALGEKIVKAMETVGFLYLVNHGVPANQVEDTLQVSRRFFGQPEEVKQQFAREEEANSWHGWVVLEKESLNPERPGDYKEAFNVTPSTAKVWPDIPGFRKKTATLFHSCQDLAVRVMQLLGIGLKLKNFRLFSESTNFDSPDNLSTLRLLYYPAITQNTELKENQMRCGEHADYGTISMLLQGKEGGLEIRTADGTFVPAPPIEGSIILNLGYLMERWTSDRLRATVHRVVVPESEAERRLCRYSMAVFVQPDNECLIEGIDGQNKYPPITSADFLVQKFKAAYQ